MGKKTQSMLYDTEQGYSVAEAALSLNCSQIRLLQWVSRGWLHGKKRPVAGHDEPQLYFSDGNIRKFIVQHPDAITPTEENWLWIFDLLVGRDRGIGTLDRSVLTEHYTESGFVENARRKRIERTGT